MKVLHAISSLDARSGGPAVALKGLARAQAESAGLCVAVISTYRSGDDLSAAEELKAAGVDVELVGPAKGPLATHPDLGKRVAAAVAKAEIVHVHALWEEIQHQAAVAARRLGKPYIIRPCGMLDPWSLRQRAWKKRLYLAWRLRRDLNGATALHFTAEQERDLTAPLKLKPPAIVEPNGVDLSEFENLPAKGTFRQQYPQIGDSPLLVFLSRVHPKKGLDILLPAFEELLRSYDGEPENHRPFLVIAGPGEPEYVASLEARARELGIAGRTLFTGMLRGPERIPPLVDADLFVLPSYQENFGIAVIEALAAGTPVVISDQVNIHREIFAAGVGGVVTLNAPALYNELRIWLRDRDVTPTIESGLREFVSLRYNWDKIAERWINRYQSTSAGRTLKGFCGK